MRKGFKHSDETLAKIRSYRHTEEAKKKISEATKLHKPWLKVVGKAPWNKGKSPDLETRKKISDSLKGRKMPWVSKSNSKRVWSNETKIKNSEHGTQVMSALWKTSWFRKRMTGENNPRWITDRTAYLEKCRIRRSKEWKEWRMAVFTRDDFTCQECGLRGVYLEPHHIVPIRKDWTKIFDLRNGITLCRPCHKKTMGKEDDFVERYLLKIKTT